MTTTTANKLTNEDYQLSEVNQLGTLLEVYRLKPGDIRFLRRIHLVRCILGVVGLALVISLGFKNWHQLQTGNYVGKTINSPLLTHKIASSLSLIRILVPFFSDAYSCPNSKLTRKPA
jgi:hypothetical protein